MITEEKDKWKEMIEAQKQSDLSIRQFCADNHISVSCFYKHKALILKEESPFLPVTVDKNEETVDFEIDHHHISCSKQNLKLILENLL